MQITTQMVKDLREQTGAGIMDAKRALETADGDFTKATQILRQQGLDRAEKKSDRSTSQGLVWSYIHGGQAGQNGGRIGTLVEVNCETDFVARTEDFRTLVRDLAMHIAASNPRYVSPDDIPEDVLAQGEAEFGDRDKFIEQVALLKQPFVKDPRRSIEELIKEQVGKLGENIVVRRYARFELGVDADSNQSS
ncbi:MAG TPA: translation elongation factor Ts [Nitrolancea sp.]|nr:translation elongation factor Ts [Nitrolancea sp.]